jgi:hypothetical protein
MTAQTKMYARSVEQLREEIAAIGRDLATIAALDAKAGRIIDEFALPAHRGDANAKKRLDEIEHARISTIEKRRRLQAAREGIEAEIRMALAAADREEVREKAREAKKIVARLRNRGADVDATIRKLIEEYNSIADDVAALSALGVSQVNLRLVQLGCERALRAKLTSIKDLQLQPVAPLERREFASLTDTWAVGAERWINSILNEPAKAMVQMLAPVAEQAQAGG